MQEEAHTMALITRVSRLFRADINAVLDRIEEPGMLLKQAVREMEDELARDEQRLKAMRLEHAQVSARAVELDRTLAGFEQELDVCFASGEEELARGVIRRRLETQRLASLLGRRRQTLQESSVALATQVEENRTRLESMRQKSEILAEEATVARGDESWSTAECIVRQEEVEVALLGEKQKRSRP
jgi:phage shock protein A